MSSESRPSTSTSPNGGQGTSSEIATTSAGSADQETRTNNTTPCCCDRNTRKFASLAYIAFIFITGVIFLVAANVSTDKKGIRINNLPVYRYLTVVLVIAIIWMATCICSKCCSTAARKGCLASHIEPEDVLLPTRLLVGVMFFGLGSSFLTMVELLEYVAKFDCPSGDLTMLFYYIVRTIFIYIQLYFFYKLSRKTEKVLIFSHFLMMHLIAVNLGTWIVTFVYDSAEELNEDSDEKHDGKSTMLFMSRHWGVEFNSTKKECYETAEALESTAEKMEPYLYTFTMEYCLISAGLLLNAWLSLRSSTGTANQGRNEGEETDRTGSDGVRDGFRSQSRIETNQNDNHKRHFSRSVEHRGKGHNGQKRSREDYGSITHDLDINRGFDSDDSWEHVETPERGEVGTLWRFGFILGLAYIPVFTAIIFNLIFTDDQEQDQLVYIGMQFFFLLSILIASVIGIRQLGNVDNSKTHSQVDFILLGVSLVGVFFLDLLIIVAAFCEMSESPALTSFLIVANITELLSSVMFTLFVRKALEHELPEKPDKVVSKSASNIREVVSFLFMLNICFWGMYTFEVKKSTKAVPIVEHFYTENVWFYLSHFVYPLAVFFHFHGAVCMFEVLNHYSISKSRTVPGSASVSMSVQT